MEEESDIFLPSCTNNSSSSNSHAIQPSSSASCAIQSPNPDPSVPSIPPSFSPLLPPSVVPSASEEDEDSNTTARKSQRLSSTSSSTKQSTMEVVETRQKRRKPRPGEWWCPVCGVTLRPGELESHLTHELDKLVRLPHTRPLAQRRPPPAVAAHAAHAGPSTSSGRPGTHIWKTFQEVRGKREARGQRRRGGNGAVTCPVCGRILPPDDPELHTHIDDCLRRTEEEDVEVEGVEEYEWCGQTRVRATMMLRAEGQLHALGTKVERGSEDEMVDVCDDDVLAFGPVQYSDADLPDAAHDDPFTPPPPRENHVTSPQPSTSAAHSLGNDVTRAGEEQDDREDDGGAGTMGGGGGGGEGPVVAALRARMRELEAVAPRHGHTCRVCHDVYDKPLVSVLCWHVYCEQCWLSALAAKKLCPQCSGITSASDLRRIYL